MSLNNSSGLLTAYPYCQWPSQGRKSPRFGSFGFQRSLKLQARNRVCSRSSFFLSFSKSGCAQHPSITLRQGSCRNFTGAYICKILSTRGCTRLRRRRSKFSHNVQCEADHGTNNGTVYPNEASNERMKVDENDDCIPSFSLVEEKRRENIYMPNVEVNPLALGGIHEEIWKVGEISIQKKAVPDETRLRDHDLAQEDEQKNSFENEAWELLRASVVNYCGYPVGTIAANDPSNPDRLNYDQVFIRDFIPSGLAFLLNGETEIVRNFLLHTLQLQSWEKTVDCHSPGEGLMPASFKIHSIPLDGDNYDVTEEISEPDFGEAAIGRVAPVDSGLWWIILLRAYGKYTGDYALQERIDVQTGMRLILKLCLADGFDMFPTLLVTDGSCMIDRRMGIHGHPLEIQALFFSALSCAKEMLTPIDNSTHDVIMAINSRLKALCFHIREYYWLDMKKLNQIYRYKTEEYSCDAVNKFNIYPEQIPQWLVDWIPDQGGYLIGNLQPAHMDFRFFSLGNLWSIVGSLVTGVQAEGILDLIEHRWNDLVGKMPVKICFPALEQDEWRIITGSDPKNTLWSYHNGGSWPTLLWQFTVACIKMGKLELAQKAVKVAEDRLSSDSWPEYYDTRTARLIGKQAHLYQTWTIAGYLVAKMMLARPEAASILTFEEDLDLSEATKKCLLMKNLHGTRSCVDFLCEGV